MTEWFEEWFGEEYLQLYPHRDGAEADRAVGLIAERVAMEPGWRVLDVGCGAGRHARAFEQARTRCVGLDLSAALLRVARTVTGSPLVRADMRALPIRPRSMDLTVNLFTSFGYFEQDAEHAGALGEMVSTLRRGGWFVIDFLNASSVRARLVPHEVQRLGGVEVEVERSVSPDGRFVCKQIRTATGRFTERVRLFGAGEIEAMLAPAGVTVRERYGDYDASPLLPHSPRTILFGQAG
ncbi:MAG TPA: class I SAM-dependent methyltransferase [Gemmatimonadales bacterium]|jgi:SAM-dependent methyltransferase|nr:class I SAM-dependent methyltransferase [Gemmatimonadales bacterium]